MWKIKINQSRSILSAKVVIIRHKKQAKVKKYGEDCGKATGEII